MRYKKKFSANLRQSLENFASFLLCYYDRITVIMLPYSISSIPYPKCWYPRPTPLTHFSRFFVLRWWNVITLILQMTINNNVFILPEVVCSQCRGGGVGIYGQGHPSPDEEGWPLASKYCRGGFNRPIIKQNNMSMLRFHTKILWC